MEYLEIIKRKTFRPIKSADILSPKFIFWVEFEDGVQVSRKDDVGLRKFLCSVQNPEYKIISGKTEHCVPSQVGYWELLGFRANDAILFRDEKGRTLPILFSSTSKIRPSGGKRNDI